MNYNLAGLGEPYVGEEEDGCFPSDRAIVAAPQSFSNPPGETGVVGLPSPAPSFYDDPLDFTQWQIWNLFRRLYAGITSLALGNLRSNNTTRVI